MNRRNALIISFFLAVALVLGTAAILRTAALGAQAASTAPSAAQLQAKSRQLDRYEAQLRRAAKQTPPALPALPRRPAATAPAAQSPQVIYVRPKPIVNTIHRQGDDGYEHEDGQEHEGGELDD